MCVSFEACGLSKRNLHLGFLARLPFRDEFCAQVHITLGNRLTLILQVPFVISVALLSYAHSTVVQPFAALDEGAEFCGDFVRGLGLESIIISENSPSSQSLTT